jgi:hypothetical protein
MKIVIDHQFKSLNEYIQIERGNKYAAAFTNPSNINFLANEILSRSFLRSLTCHVNVILIG